MVHLAIQPVLLTRFLADESPTQGQVSLEANLAGTAAMAAAIDQAARQAADAGRLDFPANVRRALPALHDADLTRTVVTLQGPIALADYLVTRCVEAVVHGLDLVPGVPLTRPPRAIAADALLRLLAQRAPHLATLAAALDRVVWLEAATGRRTLSGPLGQVLPLLA